MKRVFILGAGLSKSCGIPLASELTCELLEELGLEESDREELMALRDSLGTSTSPDQLADALRNGDLSGPEHGDLARWWSNEVPRLMEEALMKLIHQRSSPAVDAMPSYVTEFVRALCPDDVIITFNYDLMIEVALRQQKINFGFEPTSQRMIGVFKLHGSIDWRPCSLPGQLRPGIEVLYEGTPSANGHHRLIRVTDPKKLQVSVSTPLEALSLDGHPSFGLPYLGLGAHKRDDLIPGLRMVWRSAEQALSEATAVFVVGYSMPLTDPEPPRMFARASSVRSQKLERLVVVDPNALDLLPRYESAFRSKVQPLKERAEDIDWIKLING